MFYLIVTTRFAQGEYLKRFLTSLYDLPKAQQERIFLVLVIQSDVQVEVEINHAIAHKICCVPPCSASKARNIGLSHLPNCSGIVAFPDDDCWYNDKILPHVESVFEQTNADFVSVGVFDPIRKIPYGRNRPVCHIENINLVNALYLPIEVSLFIRFDNQKDITRFDENFSIGTNWGSGEATDMVLKLLNDKKQGLYNSYALVFHEYGQQKDGDKNRIFRYAVGFGAVLAKAIFLRQQNLTRQYKAMCRRNFFAHIIFFWSKKGAVYKMRLKGLRQGFAEGKKFYNA